MNPTYAIFSSSKHPLHEKLKNLGHDFFDMEKSEPFEDKFTHYMKYQVIFDFSLSAKEKKLKLLERLNKESNVRIVSELSCYWGEECLRKFSKLRAGFASAFYSPKNACEFFSLDEDLVPVIQDFFSSLGLKGVPVQGPGICFTFPRILSMIINEAYFARGEKLATSSDLDLAMRFGVNYPLGPIDWAQKIGHKKVVMVLDELHAVTGDPRYQVAPLLRLEANPS